MTDSLRSAKLQTWHLDRAAIVYIRQSTPQQVLEHQESTCAPVRPCSSRPGPRLAARACRRHRRRPRQEWSIGGRAARLPTSARRSSSRSRRSHPGHRDESAGTLVQGLAPVARTVRRFRTLLADADGLYDPTDFNDRLLLGLKGTMSEAELHILKARMYQGKLNKARRGELFGLPPIGYVKLPSGEFALDPDEQVQTVVRLVFDQFDRQGTLHGLLRYLANHGIQLPVRARGGVQQGQLQWCRPCRETLQNLLHHPIYAGAYRYGHRPIDPRKKQPGRPSTGKQVRRPEECTVLLRDRLPAYITWERFEANQQRLAADRAS